MSEKYYLGSERKRGLLLLAILAAGLYTIAARAERQVAQPWLADKLATIAKLSSAQSVILAERKKLGIPLSPDDREQTGWIGVPVSMLTTEPGSLSAKRSATNPNFGAVIVDLLGKSGVRKGDAVAVGMSGSFPALNTAVIAGIEQLGARPIVISSVGSSQWGANQPGFSWLHVEKALYAAHVIRHKSVAVGPGGSSLLDPRILSALDTEMGGVHIKRLDERDLAGSIKERLSIYQREAGKRRMATFVNVGGAAANVGMKSPTGLVTSPTQEGVMGAFRRQGVPVIDLRQIKKLCTQYNLPWDPSPLPSPGDGTVYYQGHKSPVVVGLCLMALAFSVWIVTRGRLPGMRQPPLDFGETIRPSR